MGHFRLEDVDVTAPAKFPSNGSKDMCICALKIIFFANF